MKSPYAEAPNRILLIDGPYMMRRLMRIKKYDETQINELFQRVQANVKRAVSQTQATHVIFAMDADPVSWRHLVHTEYAARTELPLSVYNQLPALRESLSNAQVKVLTHDGVEAADILGTVLAKVNNNRLCCAYLLSGRKGLQAWTSDQVWLYDFMAKRGADATCGPDAVRERFGVDPERIPDLLTLTGDDSFSLPGIAGVGPVNAAKLLSAYGSLAGIAEHVNAIDGKLGKSLRDGLPQARERCSALHRVRSDMTLSLMLRDFRLQTPQTIAEISI